MISYAIAYGHTHAYLSRLVPVYPSPGVFERDGIHIPRFSWNPFLTITVACEGSGSFCDGMAVTTEPAACPAGFMQTAYDQCCAADGPCVDPDGGASSPLS